MRYYAEGIRKFQKQLGLPVKRFPDLGLYEREDDANNDVNDDTDDPKKTTDELESSSTIENDVEQDSYDYESEVQRRWRERMEKYY